MLALWVLALALSVWNSSWAAVNARLDRARAVVGETVVLVLETNDPQQGLGADFSALEADFRILDQRSETQVAVVNGRRTAEVRLLVTLEPRREGRLTIPSLTVPGGLKTPVLSLQVDPAPELAPGEAPPVFVELELDPVEGPYYVHAQLSLRVRIFYLPTLTEAAINPPAPAQASVRLLDEVPYQADRNGEKYRVLERRYAVFPERSGELTIPPLQLTGRLMERQNDRLWQPSGRGRRLTVQSDPLVLDIQPRPPEFSGDNWLPARQLTLAQQVADVSGLRVGEPVTRTVLLDAIGLEENMLVEPAWPELSGARVYPDQPQGITRDDGEWVLGHREFRYAVVPETAGELVLPEIRLAWWDTVNHREQVAVLPEHRVQVAPAQVGPIDLAAPLTQIEAPGALDPGGSGVIADGVGGLQGAWTWQALSAVLALLWLSTLALYLRGRHTVPTTSASRGPVPKSLSERELLAACSKACAAGDASAAHAAWSAWLRTARPGEDLLAFAEALGNESLAQHLRALDAHRYGKEVSSGAPGWDAAGTWQAFERWRRQSAQPSRPDAADELELYPR